MNTAIRILLLCATVFVVESALAQEQDPSSSMTPEELAGQCLVYQSEIRMVQRELEDAIRVPSDRLSAVSAALHIIGQKQRSDAEEVERLQAQAIQLEAQVAHLQAVLLGESMPRERAVTRGELLEQIEELTRQLERTRMLAEVQALDDAWARQRRMVELSLLKDELELRIETLRTPYRDEINRMRQRAGVLSRLLDQAMQGYGRPVNVGDVQAEAVRVSSRFEHGLIQFRWTDRRGQMVASAQVNLRPSPETEQQPPLLQERFSILQQDNQEVTLNVGYFEVRFRADVPELMGERNLLEAVSRLLDLEALDELVPQVGNSGVN